jgi:hypothetical protein
MAPAAVTGVSPLGFALKKLVTPNNVKAATAWGATAATAAIFLVQVSSLFVLRAPPEGVPLFGGRRCEQAGRGRS